MPELTPAEESWARGYVRGVARLLAMGPPAESPEEFMREVERIERVALEPGAQVFDTARRWRARLLEVLR